MLLLVSALLLPIIGTALGAGGVFIKGIEFSKTKPHLLSLSAGIMLASSFWSLMIPAFEKASASGICGISIPLLGVWSGVLFIISVEGATSKYINGCNSKSASFMTAVTIHNIPEGIAVGIACAGAFSDGSLITKASALSLAIGIALQNIPEGAVISLPLYYSGKTRSKAFLYGVLSGISEPVFAFIALFSSGIFSSLLPLFLGFAAGAMIYVTVCNLLPDVYESTKNPTASAIIFFVGFTVMTVADKMV